jgi:CDP-4-dehydro-6-deoxyglucose reductase
MIRRGDLATFEGMVVVEELLRAFPDVKLEDDAALERLEGIKDAAFARRVRERILPSAEVLVARLAEASRDLEGAQARSEAYRDILERLCGKLAGMAAGGAAREAASGLLGWLERELQSALRGEPQPGLLVQERFMRIMTAHVQVRPSGHEYFVEGSETLLESALRAGLAVDYGCSGGTCGKCKARVISGQVQKVRHSDYPLTAGERSAGVVLMCCNTAVVDLVIEAHEARGAADMPQQAIEARVKTTSELAGDMRLLHLQTPRTDRLRFLAGQSVTLAVAGAPASAFPVASCPCDDRNLHFHVPRQPGDAFSERVFAGLKAGDTVRVEGPVGQFVLDEESHRPLAFVAGNAGFAPVKSLIEHAMALDTAETISLYWIASGPNGPYLDNLCRSWAAALDNFRYVPVKAEGPLSDAAAARRALAQALEDPAWGGERDVYVAGPAAMAGAAKSLLLEKGVARERLSVLPLGDF